MRPKAERVRVPSPLIPWRLPSGRGATEQPNATGDGDAPLTMRFWVLLVFTGVATGLLADLMMAVPDHQRLFSPLYAYDLLGFQTQRDNDRFHSYVRLYGGGRIVGPGLLEAV